MPAGRRTLSSGEGPWAVTIEQIIEGMAGKSRLHLARAISMVEDELPEAALVLSTAYKNRKGASVIGITGAPGVGKSTLVDSIVGALRASGRTVGVVAVDPSSPFTGGAILGDRVRMSRERGTDSGVFFRSLATRGHLGGLSRHTGDVIALLDAYGFDDILVETVGTGQSEVDIMRYAHTVVVVLSPGLGDDVQAIKAGILEIGDVFCVNKADLPHADKVRREIEAMLSMKERNGWLPPVVETVAVSPGHAGVEDLVSAMRAHQQYLMSSGLLEKKKLATYRAVLEEYLRHLTVDKILRDAERDGSLAQRLESLASSGAAPLEVASQMVADFMRRGAGRSV